MVSQDSAIAFSISAASSLLHMPANSWKGDSERLSLKDEVAYMHSQGDVRRVFLRGASRLPLVIVQSLKTLKGLVDPNEFFLVNRNYLVHWPAIARWKDEESGRRVKVWLEPPVYKQGRFGEKETYEYISKEKADLFKAWYEECLARNDATWVR